MADDIALNKAISRKAQAEALMRNELLVEAFDTLERSYYEGWRNTSAKDTEARERLFIAANQVAKVRDHLRNVIDRGTLAQKELDQLTARPRRFGVV